VIDVLDIETPMEVLITLVAFAMIAMIGYSLITPVEAATTDSGFVFDMWPLIVTAIIVLSAVMWFQRGMQRDDSPMGV